jgi:hypothetical protein
MRTPVGTYDHLIATSVSVSIDVTVGCCWDVHTCSSRSAHHEPALSRHRHDNGVSFTLHWRLHLLGSFVVSILSARCAPIKPVFTKLCSRFLQLRSFADCFLSTRQRSCIHFLHTHVFSSSLAWVCPLKKILSSREQS